MTSKQTYELRQKQVKELMAKIEKQFIAHEKRQNITPQSWGHAGDLAYVLEQLENISNFLPKTK